MYAHYVLMSESSAKLAVMWWHGGVGSAVEIAWETKMVVGTLSSC